MRKTEKKMVEREVEVGTFCDLCGLAFKPERTPGKVFVEGEVRHDDTSQTAYEAEFCPPCVKDHVRVRCIVAVKEIVPVGKGMPSYFGDDLDWFVGHVEEVLHPAEGIAFVVSRPDRNGWAEIHSPPSSFFVLEEPTPTGDVEPEPSDLVKHRKVDVDVRAPLARLDLVPGPPVVIRPLRSGTIARIRTGIQKWPEPDRLKAEAALAAVEGLRSRFEACFKCGGGEARRYVERWIPGVLANTTRRPDREVFLCDSCHASKAGDEDSS